MATDSKDAHTEIDANPLRNLPQVTRPIPAPSSHSCSLNELKKRFPNVNSELFSSYPLRRGRVGYCVIINEKNFDPSTGQNTRDGTDRDAESLEITFTKLGFTVDRHDNVSLYQLDNILKKYHGAEGEKTHRDCDMFAFCILSHGEDGIVYTRDASIKIESLFRLFRADNCSGLIGKPKLFFIQACRGNKFDKGVPLSDAEADSKQDLKIPVEADFLIAYSVVPGFYSWRNNEDGSWFVQALTAVLENFVVPYLHAESVSSDEPKPSTSSMDVDGGVLGCFRPPPASPRSPPGRGAGDEHKNNSASGSTSVPETTLASSNVDCEAQFFHPPPYNLLELMTLVNRLVAYSFESHTGSSSTDRMKQMPQICSTLTHLLYFQHKYPVPSAPLAQPRPTRPNY